MPNAVKQSTQLNLNKSQWCDHLKKIAEWHKMNPKCKAYVNQNEDK